MRMLIAVAGVITALSTVGAGTAHADGHIDAAEADYIAEAGATICSVISRREAEEDVLGMADTITKDGFAYDSAQDIINTSVKRYCPQHWPLLVEMGRKPY